MASPGTPINGVAPTGNGDHDSGYSPGGGVSGLVGSGIGGGGSTNRFFTNVSMAGSLSWELDFWGLFRRNVESANGNLDQSVQNYDEAVRAAACQRRHPVR